MRLGPALNFIVGVEKSLVFLDGPADGAAKLILPKNVGSSCLQEIDGVQLVVPEIFVERAVPFVGAAPSNDVYDSSGGASKFRRIIGIDDAKFLDRLLRRGATLDSGGGGDVIGAIDGNEIVMNVLSSEGKLSDGLDDHICAAGSGVSNSDGRRKQGKIDELAAIDRDVHGLLSKTGEFHGNGVIAGRERRNGVFAAL